MKTKIEASTDQLDLLHAALDKTRATSRTVKVNAEALRVVLRDHGKLHARYRKEVDGGAVLAS